MACAINSARRSLVALLKALAKTYGVVLALSRDSSDAQINTAVRKVSLKAHPDHGGSEEDQKLLNTTRDAWRDAVEQNTPSHQVLIMIPVTEKSLEKIMEMCTTLLVFLFARPETPHHRYESSLSDVSVCLSICFRSCESWLASEGGVVSIRNSRLLDPIHVQARRTQSWPPDPPLESYHGYLYGWIGILGAIGSV